MIPAAQLLIEMANDEYLGNELVFRGGLCLHKLHLTTAPLDSEDRDDVRTTTAASARPSTPQVLRPTQEQCRFGTVPAELSGTPPLLEERV